MLTSDLLRVRVRGSTVVPQYVDPSRNDLLEPAEAFVAAARDAVAEGWTQGELDGALKDAIGPHRSAKVLQGLAKLVRDRCDAEAASTLDPATVRQAVFARAAEVGPLAREAGALGRPVAADVLAHVAEALGATVADVSHALYADLKDAAVVTAFRELTPEALIHRYNVALVQGVLLKATEVVVELHDPTVPRVRQLLRHAKFRELMVRAERDDDVLRLVLDGPTSLFKQSTRYGMQLATFFPAVLLQDPPWRMTATVLWTKARHRKTLEVGPDDGLVSHYADTGAYASRAAQWFEERWAAAEADGPWTMTDDTVPIDLGGRGLILPDYTFTDGTRTAHLEIVGYWRKDWLQRRLEGLRRHGPGNLILAVSRKLAGEAAALDDAGAEVVPFAQVVPVREVVAALDRVAR